MGLYDASKKEAAMIIDHQKKKEVDQK